MFYVSLWTPGVSAMAYGAKVTRLDTIDYGAELRGH